MRNSLKQILLLCSFLIMASGCKSTNLEVTEVPPTRTLSPADTTERLANLPTHTPTHSYTPTSFLTQTPIPTFTPTALATESPTPTLTPSPTASIWVSSGTAVPQSSAPISANNANNLTQLARWGRGEIRDVAFSEDGRWLVVATATGIYLHSTSDLNETPQWIRTNVPVDKVAFSPDSSLLMAILPRTGIYIWRAEDGELLRTIPETASDFAFSPDGQFFALIFPVYENTVQLWSLLDNQKIAEFNSSSTIAFSSDGATYAIATEKERSTYIEIYRLPDHELSNSFEVDMSSNLEIISSLAFSTDNQLLILGKDGQWYDVNSVEVRQVDDGEILLKIEGIPAHTGIPYFCDSGLVNLEPLYPPAPVAIEVSPDGQQFSVTYKGGDTYGSTVAAYSLANGQLRHRFEEGTNSLTYSPDGHLIITGSDDGKIYFWQAENFNLNQTISAYNSAISGIEFSPDGQVLAAENNYGVELRDVTNGALISDFPEASKISFSPDGIQIALGFPDGHIEVRSLIDRSLIYQINDQTSSIRQLQYSPDNQYLITSAQDCTENIYRAMDGLFLRTLEDFVADIDLVGETRLPVGGIAISDDSSKIIGSFTAGPEFGFWELDTGQLIRVFSEEEIAGVWNFVPVSGREMFVGLGGTYSTTDFSFWDMDDASFIYEWSGTDRSNYYYVRLAISPDGNLLAASTNQGTIDVWEIDSQQLMFTLFFETFVYRVDFFYSPDIVFSPDGRYLASGTSDGLIYLWGIP